MIKGIWLSPYVLFLVVFFSCLTYEFSPLYSTDNHSEPLGTEAHTFSKDDDTISDILSSEGDFAARLQKHENEQLKLYQKIINERDSFMRDHSTPQDAYFPYRQDQVQPLASYPPQLNFPQDLTSLAQKNGPFTFPTYHHVNSAFPTLQHQYHPQQLGPSQTSSPNPPLAPEWHHTHVGYGHSHALQPQIEASRIPQITSSDSHTTLPLLKGATSEYVLFSFSIFSP